MKVKSLVSAAALFAGALIISPSWAAEPLTNEQMDAVSAGGSFELGPFQTTLLDVANQQYVDTFNVMNPYFSAGDAGHSTSGP